MKWKTFKNVKYKQDNSPQPSRHASANGASTNMGWVYGNMTSDQLLNQTVREEREVSNKSICQSKTGISSTFTFLVFVINLFQLIYLFKLNKVNII